MRNRWMAGLLTAAIVTLSVAGPARAVGAEVDTGVGVVTKLFRGIANAATGWMEIPKQITREWKNGGPGPGLTWGLIKGTGFAVGRSAVGAYEIVTFPMPIPDGYRPILEPEYVFSDIGTAPRES